MRRLLILILFLSLPALGFAAEKPRALPVDSIKLPPGFRIEVYSDDVPNARSMTLSPQGVLYVGTRASDKVYAITDDDQDNHADQVRIIAEKLKSPNGVAFRDGSLYVAEIHRILRFDDIDNHLDDPPKPVVVNQQLPKDGWHGWKFIRFGPDGLLYIPVGAPCNVCEKEDLRFASILRMNPDGSNLKLFARGIRNTVGFDWDPRTKELWFTDNGRDNLTDNLPPDELNHAPKAGMDFGFPYCHGKAVNDPEFTQYPCSNFIPAARELGPHVAALGMRFYTGGMFPSEYQNQIFIAEHGSWNRTDPLGYRVMLVRLKNNQPVSYEIFAEGWLQSDGKPWGRPVDVQVMPDGALLVSDDHAGAIYRISYESNSADVESHP